MSSSASSRVDAPLRLGLGHALHAVSAALEAERAVGAVALHREEDFLVAVERRLVRAHHVDFPAARLAVAGVHAEEVAREQRRLVAARAGAHLEHGVASLQRIRRQQAGQHGALGVRLLGLQPLQLLLGHRTELGVFQQRLVAVDVVQQLEVARGGGLQLAQCRMLRHDGAVALRVGDHRRVAHGGLHLAEPSQHVGYL